MLARAPGWEEQEGWYVGAVQVYFPVQTQEDSCAKVELKQHSEAHEAQWWGMKKVTMRFRLKNDWDVEIQIPEILVSFDQAEQLGDAGSRSEHTSRTSHLAEAHIT